MSILRIKIKIYSDKKDTASLTSIVKQLEFKDTIISCVFPRSLEVNPDEIIIFQIDNVQSRLLRELVTIKKELKNKFIFIIRNENALLISTIVKLGFNDIFLLPHEIYKFTAYLNEIILNKQYLTPSISITSELDIYDFNSIIGNSGELSKVIEIAKRVSENDKVSVLILGETGTGKGLLAKAIHKNSISSGAPFVEIVCSAIPEELLESELFGYERGAFTNALNRKLGLFELAENGTLFLDEIGDLSLNLQVKLLRVIEKKVIRRLGGIEDIPVSTRIISATNRNLKEMMENNLFRKDLYHRLNVVSLEIPPLRSRKDDIIILARHFINEFNKQFGKSIRRIEKDLEMFMLEYPWPGNIRELRNAIERAVLLSDEKKLRLTDFSNLLKSLPLNVIEKSSDVTHPHLINLNLNYEMTSLKKLTKIYAKEVLKKNYGNKSKSAKFLGISRPKLDSLIK